MLIFDAVNDVLFIDKIECKLLNSPFFFKLLIYNCPIIDIEAYLQYLRDRNGNAIVILTNTEPAKHLVLVNELSAMEGVHVTYVELEPYQKFPVEGVFTDEIIKMEIHTDSLASQIGM